MLLNASAVKCRGTTKASTRQKPWGQCKGMGPCGLSSTSQLVASSLCSQPRTAQGPQAACSAALQDSDLGLGLLSNALQAVGPLGTPPHPTPRTAPPQPAPAGTWRGGQKWLSRTAHEGPSVLLPGELLEAGGRVLIHLLAALPPATQRRQGGGERREWGGGGRGRGKGGARGPGSPRAVDTRAPARAHRVEHPVVAATSSGDETRTDERRDQPPQHREGAVPPAVSGQLQLPAPAPAPDPRVRPRTLRRRSSHGAGAVRNCCSRASCINVFLVPCHQLSRALRRMRNAS